MDITYYIRENSNEYPEPCSSAIIEIIKNGKKYYGGAQWGHHTPSNVVNFINANCDQLNFISWIISIGYEPVPPTMD